MSEKAEGGGGDDDDDHDGIEDKPKRVHARRQRTGGCIKARTLLLRPIKKLQARRDHNHHHQQRQQQQPPLHPSRPPYDEDFATTGCHLCFMPPVRHRSPNRSASTDGSKPPSYHDFLRSLLEKNDFYSPDCNVHREVSSPF